jgi:hypothetical protein
MGLPRVVGRPPPVTCLHVHEKERNDEDAIGFIDLCCDAWPNHVEPNGDRRPSHPTSNEALRVDERDDR